MDGSGVVARCFCFLLSVGSRVSIIFSRVGTAWVSLSLSLSLARARVPLNSKSIMRHGDCLVEVEIGSLLKSIHSLDDVCWL